MMRIANPIWNSHINRIDRLFDDFRMAQLPADGDVIERSRIVTEKFKVSHMEDGEVRLTPITDEVAKEITDE